MINENLYNDLFLESHQKLAIKSLQTLNGFENILLLRNLLNKSFELHKIDLEPIGVFEDKFFISGDFPKDIFLMNTLLSKTIIYKNDVFNFIPINKKNNDSGKQAVFIIPLICKVR